MAGSSKDKRKGTSAKRAGTPAKKSATRRDADWTDGLKKLYDTVVDEPLPETFRDLLSKLDAED